MNTTTIQRTETIRLADALKRRTPFLDGSSTIDHAEKELRRQHAEIARLTAENEALRSAVSDAVAAERMACMVVCDQLQAPKSYTTDEQSLWDVATMACTEAIRARGTP